MLMLRESRILDASRSRAEVHGKLMEVPTFNPRSRAEVHEKLMEVPTFKRHFALDTIPHRRGVSSEQIVEDAVAPRW
jgi:hypothetical protein